MKGEIGGLALPSDEKRAPPPLVAVAAREGRKEEYKSLTEISE